MSRRPHVVVVGDVVLDQDIEGAGAVSQVLSSIGQDPAAWIGRATSDQVKLRLRMHTEEAKARGTFGAPTFFAGEEMFWGNDRLEQALEWAGRCD